MKENDFALAEAAAPIAEQNRALRRLGSYGASLGRLPDETWRTYYERWRRHTQRRKI